MTDAVDRLNSPYEWRFTAGGSVVHALRKAGDSRALCGRYRPASLWMGTGSQDEYETAAALSSCEKCLVLIDGGRFAGRQKGGPRRKGD
jgi:hypothetical protein